MSSIRLCLKVVSDGSESTGPSIVLELDRVNASGSSSRIQQILVNCGECASRILIEEGIKLSSADVLLVTRVSSSCVAGLPSLIFHLSERGAAAIEVVGPPPLSAYKESISSFVSRRHPTISVREETDWAYACGIRAIPESAIRSTPASSSSKGSILHTGFTSMAGSSTSGRAKYAWASSKCKEMAGAATAQVGLGDDLRSSNTSAALPFYNIVDLEVLPRSSSGFFASNPLLRQHDWVGVVVNAIPIFSAESPIPEKSSPLVLSSSSSFSSSSAMAIKDAAEINLEEEEEDGGQMLISLIARNASTAVLPQESATITSGGNRSMAKSVATSFSYLITVPALDLFEYIPAAPEEAINVTEGMKEAEEAAVSNVPHTVLPRKCSVRAFILILDASSLLDGGQRDPSLSPGTMREILSGIRHVRHELIKGLYELFSSSSTESSTTATAVLPVSLKWTVVHSAPCNLTCTTVYDELLGNDSASRCRNRCKGAVLSDGAGSSDECFACLIKKISSASGSAVELQHVFVHPCSRTAPSAGALLSDDSSTKISKELGSAMTSTAGPFSSAKASLSTPTLHTLGSSTASSASSSSSSSSPSSSVSSLPAAETLPGCLVATHFPELLKQSILLNLAAPELFANPLLPASSSASCTLRQSPMIAPLLLLGSDSETDTVPSAASGFYRCVDALAISREGHARLKKFNMLSSSSLSSESAVHCIDNSATKNPAAAEQRYGNFISFLGTGAAAPSKRRSCSGIYICMGSSRLVARATGGGGRLALKPPPEQHIGGRTEKSADSLPHLSVPCGFLLDIGEGCLSRLHLLAPSVVAQSETASSSSAFLSGVHLTAMERVVAGLMWVWVSHMHADHHTGLLGLLSIRVCVSEKAAAHGIVLPRLLITGPQALGALTSMYMRIVSMEGLGSRVQERESGGPRSTMPHGKASVSGPVSLGEGGGGMGMEFPAATVEYVPLHTFRGLAPFLALERCNEASPSQPAKILRLVDFDTTIVEHSCREAFGCVITLLEEGGDVGSPGSRMGSSSTTVSTPLQKGDEKKPRCLVLAYSGDTRPCRSLRSLVITKAQTAKDFMGLLCASSHAGSPAVTLSSAGHNAGSPAAALSRGAPTISAALETMKPVLADQEASSPDEKRDEKRVAVLLIHEATFNDDRFGDALAKKHSTIGEALEVANGIRRDLATHKSPSSASLGSTAPADVSAAFYRGTILTHFSQRYPTFPTKKRGGDRGGSKRGASGMPESTVIFPSLYKGMVTKKLRLDGAGVGDGGNDDEDDTSDRSGSHPSTANSSSSSLSSANSSSTAPLPSSEPHTSSGTIEDGTATAKEFPPHCLLAFDGLTIPLFPSREGVGSISGSLNAGNNLAVPNNSARDILSDDALCQHVMARIHAVLQEDERDGAGDAADLSED